jgi:hypothetical protein
MMTAAFVVLVTLAQADAGTVSWRDVKHLDGIGRRFDHAVLKKDKAVLKKIDDELRGMIRRELDAMRGRADADEKTLEKTQGQKDGGTNGRRADAREDIAIGGRLFALGNELATLEGKQDDASLEHKRALIDRLIGLAEQERRREMREQHLDENP